MKTKIFLAALLVSGSCYASNFNKFLKSCAYGALAGAGVGVVSLALENQPSDHIDNVARGASLGLYAGIAYGIYQINQKPNYKYYQDMNYGTYIAPKFDQARLDGLEINSTIYIF